MENVYIVVYRSPDIKDHFVEIKGTFRSKDEASKWREHVFESQGKHTTIETFILMDTLEND